VKTASTPTYVSGVCEMISNGDFEKKQLVFVFARDGEKLSFSNDNLIVKDKNGVIKHQSTCWRIFSLFVVGNITISSGLIQRAKKFCFSIVLMNSNLRVYQVLGFQAEGNTLLRQRQYNCSDEEKLEIAIAILQNKVANQRKTLLKQRARPESVNAAICSLKRIKDEMTTDPSIYELMGHEGVAAKLYFSSIFNNCEWNGRKPRSKQDYINTTLDIGYTVLFNFIEALTLLYGFDLYVGFAHQMFYMRKSLVCDLVEPFRPIIDYQIRKAISLQQCKQEDFELTNNAWYLKREKNKDYVIFLVEPLVKEKNEIFKYIQGFYRYLSRGKSIDNFPEYEL
jgi:CRISP-associated protein Cas1